MKQMKKTLTLVFTSLVLSGCAGISEGGHEHKFSNKWAFDETNHWHEATCEHTELTSNLSSHTFDENYRCTECGYTLPAKKYLVSFNTNCGSYIPSYLTAEGSTIVTPEEPTKENYAFYGWYDNPTFDGKIFDFNTKVNSDITLYARWGYSVEFINYDGSTYYNEVLLEGEKTTLDNEPTKANETFYGWFENNDFEGERFDLSSEIHKNTILYAGFGFLVNFYTYDGSLFSSEIVHEGNKLKVPNNPTKNYYDFDVWCTDQGLTTPYNFNEVVTQEFNLYSRFDPSTYSITYVGCDGAINLNPDSYIYTIGLNSLIAPLKDGYRFYGWYSDQEFKNKVTSIDANSHENIQLFAYFSKIYKVTYKNWPSDITNPNPAEFTVEERENLELDPFKDNPGFTFVSYTDSDQKIHVSTDLDQDMELTVNYNSTKTHLTLNANGGHVVGLNNYVYLNSLIPGKGPEKFDIPAFNDEKDNGFNPNLHVPEYEGHVFRGWFLDQECKTAINDSLTTVQCGQTLYAKWEEIPAGVGNIKDGIAYAPEWQKRPYQYTKIDKVLLPLNLKKIEIYYFASCSNGSVAISSNAVYIGGTVSHHIYSSKPNVDFIYDSVKVDVTSDEAITASVQLSYNSSTFDECLPRYSYEFHVISYREQYIKAAPQDSVSIDVNYWDAINLPYIEREGYAFDGWYNGNTLVDISKHFALTSESITLTAHWKQLEN